MIFYESNRGNPEWHYVSPALPAPEGSRCTEYHLVIEAIDWEALGQPHPMGRYTGTVSVVIPQVANLEEIAKAACISMEEMHSHWTIPVLEVLEFGYRASLWEGGGEDWESLFEEAKAFCGEGLDHFSLRMDPHWQACGVK